MMKLTPLKSLCLMLIGTAFSSQAAINLDRTRIVFPETDKASSLKVDNQSKTLPILRSRGSKTKTVVRKTATLWRFLRSSALNRIVIPGQDREAGGQQRAAKRSESLFYFNLREVPPKAPASTMIAASCRSPCRAVSSCSGARRLS